MEPSADASSRGDRRESVTAGAREWPRIVLLFLAAVAIRGAVALRTAVIFNDGPIFIALGKQIGSGELSAALSHPYHPLYPFSIWLVQGALGDWERAAVVISIVAGGLATVGVYALLCAAFDRRVALIASLMFVVSPYAVRFTSDVQSEGVYLACFVWALVWSWRAFAAGTAIPAALAGGLTALAYLTRPEGLALLLGVGGAATWRLAVRAWTPRRWLAWVGALAGGFGLVALPYLVALHDLGDGWRVSGKKSVLRLAGISNLEDRRGVEAVRALIDARVAGLPLWLVASVVMVAAVALVVLARRRGPGAAVQPVGAPRLRGWAFVGLVLGMIALRWLPDLRELGEVLVSTLRPEVTVFFVMGLITQTGREPRPRAVFFGALLVVHLVMLFALLVNYEYLSRRHALPLIPLLSGYAALGVLWLSERIGRLLGGRVGAPHPLALSILVVLLCGIALPKTLRGYRDDALTQRLAAEWIRDQELPEGRVASVKSRVAYYAGRDWSPLVHLGEVRSVEALYGDSVRYVVVDDELLARIGELVASPGYRSREIHRAVHADRHSIVYSIGPEGAVPSGRTDGSD